MNSRGFDELEIAQREIARAIRKLASGLEPATGSLGVRSPAGGGPADGAEGSAPGSRLAETLQDGLQRAVEPIGRRGADEPRIGELSVERLVGGDGNRILPVGTPNSAAGSGSNALRSVNQAGGGTPASGGGAIVVGDGVALANTFGDAFEPVTRAVRELTAAVGTNTGAISANTSELGNGLRSVLGGFLQADKGGGGLSSFLKSGFGLAPMALGIAGLFGKKDEEPEPLRLFDAPASIAIEAANSEGILNGLRRTDRDQSGRVRTVEDRARPGPAVAPQPQVVVNVSAMDSQSFMDRSADIARALRDAMLHMHPVNDVIGEI